METVIEPESPQCVQDEKASTTLKYIREVRVNYRAPKYAPVVLREAADAATLVRRILPDNSREHIIVLYLDGAHQTIGYAVTFTGTATSCLVHPREVYQRAVLLGAVALIVAHNHPSGNVEPSEQDRGITALLKKAGECLGIKLLDHVIVTHDQHYSFADRACL